MHARAGKLDASPMGAGFVGLWPSTRAMAWSGLGTIARLLGQRDPSAVRWAELTSEQIQQVRTDLTQRAPAAAGRYMGFLARARRAAGAIQ